MWRLVKRDQAPVWKGGGAMFEDYLRPRQSFHDKHIPDLSRDAIARSRELLLQTSLQRGAWQASRPALTI
jgi:hypothetical protein